MTLPAQPRRRVPRPPHPGVMRRHRIGRKPLVQRLQHLLRLGCIPCLQQLEGELHADAGAVEADFGGVCVHGRKRWQSAGRP